jgi:hypothetical protein
VAGDFSSKIWNQILPALVAHVFVAVSLSLRLPTEHFPVPVSAARAAAGQADYFRALLPNTPA